ncbi:sulfite exporter TauE/SafE family protein [Candidatus Kaiserbacteria bacterium]|nr:sulfite exporter TauE/SafE family protein [Candidatus Kaiserbacteria bacterium]
MEYWFLLIAFCAEIAGTVAGFGSSTLAIPLSLFIFDFETALVLVAFLHIFGNVGRLTFFRHGLDTTILIRFGVPSVIATLIGAVLVSYISQDILKGILGAFLVLYVALSWSKNFSFGATTPIMLAGGGLSGFLAGLIGTGGALRGAFLTAFGLPKEKYIATAAAVALAVDITRIPVYVSQGFLDPAFYWMLPVLFVIALCGSFIGKRIVTHIPQATFRRVVLAAILLIGLKFLYDWTA